MKTSSSFQAGLRGGLLLLAIALPLSTASAEDRKKSPRKAQERPMLLSKTGSILFKAARQAERSMAVERPLSERPLTRAVRHSSAPARSTTTTGLPSQVTLTPRGSTAASTIIYVAPERLQTAAEDPYLNTLENQYSTAPAANAQLQSTAALAGVTSKPVAKPQPPVDRSKLPTATRSETMNRVVSPYPPNRELDVTGLPSGSLARDPSVGKIFILP